ncbi:putative sporulation protein YtxC [Bacillus sp. T33-2]|uniref:putative sporulation protein YtxC n=1 Tax=Bacillus sp. T33-2 TaxID=2054168 RepID=UPI000C77C19C|nr:putative sporulation protein YtxC [Bacillus sp. T33-2]PLR98101.1 putative sporulation protein YtxC [Bacillus sp. T33-2]
MVEIIFQKHQDALKLQEMLNGCLASFLEHCEILLDGERNKVKIPVKKLSAAALNKVKQGFFEFIILTKRDEWCRTILSENYFFTDPEEQGQILDILYSVLEGNRKELAGFFKGLSDERTLMAAIDELFSKKITFSFDSFVMFRLKSYIEQLGSYLKVAIDEFKMEQDYQMFVQTLREFLVGRPAQFSHLHLVIKEEAAFYNEFFEEIKRSDIVKTIDRKLVANHPVYVDSVTIAPLLSTAPTTIFLYSNDPEQPLVRTIKNIFEERVKVFPIALFYECQAAILSEPYEKM